MQMKACSYTLLPQHAFPHTAQLSWTAWNSQIWLYACLFRVIILLPWQQLSSFISSYAFLCIFRVSKRNVTTELIHFSKHILISSIYTHVPSKWENLRINSKHSQLGRPIVVPGQLGTVCQVSLVLFHLEGNQSSSFILTKSKLHIVLCFQIYACLLWCLRILSVLYSYSVLGSSPH